MVRNLKLSDRFRFLWGNKNRSHGPLVNSVIHLICWHIWVCVDRIPLLLFYDVQLEVRFLRPFYGPWPCSCVSGWQPWDVCTPSIFLSTLPTYQSTLTSRELSDQTIQGRAAEEPTGNLHRYSVKHTFAKEPLSTRDLEYLEARNYSKMKAAITARFQRFKL